MRHKEIRAFAGICLLALLCACGGGSGGAYPIGGGVYGLKGSGLVLQLNGANDLTISQSGHFTFPAQPDGSTYEVTVKTQPTGTPVQTCSVVNGSGTLNGAAVSDIEVNCSPWTKQSGGGSDTEAYGTAVDTDGNLYVTGNTDRALDGNTQSGAYDAFLIKYDRYGKRLYTRQWGAAAGTVTHAWRVAVDSSGTAWVTGDTSGSLDTNTQAGLADAFLAKFDAAGNRQIWQWGASGGYAYGQAVTTDGNGNAYVTGYTTVALDGNTKSGGVDIFLSKIDTTGARQTWEWGGSNVAVGIGVAVDRSGVIYVAGYTNAMLNGSTQTGGYDGFLTQLDTTTGKETNWQFGATGAHTYPLGLALDGNGNVYLTGYTTGALGTNKLTGTSDAFLAKFDTTAHTWQVSQWGSSGADTCGTAIAVDSSGNAYVTGLTAGSLDGATLTGSYDAFLTKIAPSGTHTTSQAGAAGVETDGNAIALDGAGHLYIAGQTAGGLDGDTLSAPGAAFDLMVLKYGTNGQKY